MSDRIDHRDLVSGNGQDSGDERHGGGRLRVHQLGWYVPSSLTFYRSLFRPPSSLLFALSLRFLCPFPFFPSIAFLLHSASTFFCRRTVIELSLPLTSFSTSTLRHSDCWFASTRNASGYLQPDPQVTLSPLPSRALIAHPPSTLLSQPLSLVSSSALLFPHVRRLLSPSSINSAC